MYGKVVKLSILYLSHLYEIYTVVLIQIGVSGQKAFLRKMIFIS